MRCLPSLAHDRVYPHTDMTRLSPTGQVSHLRTLEKENGKLTRKLETYERQHANVDVLKEANKTLEKKVRGMDELRQQIATQDAEMDALRREKKDW